MLSKIKYAFCNNWIGTNWSSWSFELRLVIDDFISITIKFKLRVSFKLHLKLVTVNYTQYFQLHLLLSY